MLGCATSRATSPPQRSKAHLYVLYVCMYACVVDDVSGMIRPAWESNFEIVPEDLSESEKNAFLSQLSGVALSSDAFFPFR